MIKTEKSRVGFLVFISRAAKRNKNEKFKMKYVKISGTDLAISEIGLGCMSLRGNLDYDQSIVMKALDSGINLLDTADLYQSGLNEELIGKAIQGKRNDLVLATKVGNQPNSDGKTWTWNPRKSYMLQAVEKSLKRLNTDYIDLYQLHGGTMEDPFDEVFEAFDLLKTQGKIRAFGISSIRPNVIRKVLSMHLCNTLMVQYNPLDRRAEEEIFDLMETSTSRVLVRGAFARGVLIDKMNAGYLNFSANEIQKLRRQILSFGFSPEAVLICFGLSQPSVASLVIGVSQSLQMEQIIRGYKEHLSIPSETIDQVKAIFPAQKYDQHRS